MRIAARPFDAGALLRTGELAAGMRRIDSLTKRISEARDELIDALYHCIPTLEDRMQRRAALKLKRNLYNARAVTRPFDSRHLPRDIAASYRVICALAAEREDVMGETQRRVMTRATEGLASLAEDTAFVRALVYASPGLARAVRRRPSFATERGTFTKLATSLYDFASRFATKANPYHTFCAVSFAPHSGMTALNDGCAEIVLSLPHLLALEEVYATDLTDERAYVYAHDYRLTSENVEVYVSSKGAAVRQVRLPRTPALLSLLDMLREEGSMPLDDLRSHLADPESLGPLFKLGVLKRFWIRDPSSPGRAFQETTCLGAGTAARLDTLHHATLSPSEVPSNLGAAELYGAEAAKRLGPTSLPAAYVNCYASSWCGHEHEEAYAAIAEDLAAVAPVMGALPNTLLPRKRLRSVLARLDGIEDGLNFYEVVAHLKKQLQIEYFQPRQPIAGARSSASAAAPTFAARAAAYDGILEASHLDALVRALPRGVAPAPGSLCMNGPVDHEHGTFYLSNVWDGGGRFLSRYRVAERTAQVSDGREEAMVSAGTRLRVRIYDPLRSNIDHTVVRERAGFALTPRHSHLFDTWIYPSDVHIALVGDSLIYTHAPSGQRLEFYHGGMGLSSGLPLEYQLLLTDQADYYRNPFAASLAPGDSVQHRSGLRFGRVHLRRAQWAVRAGALPRGDGSAVDNTVSLRSWVRANVFDDELLYYRFSGRARMTHKPRFLDLGSALSVASFLRRMAKLDPAAGVFFERMEPPPAGLLAREHGRFTTEVMIEVTRSY